MTKLTKSLPGSQIQMTLSSIQKALHEWNEIPEGADSEIDELRKKARELLHKISEQLKTLDL